MKEISEDQAAPQGTLVDKFIRRLGQYLAWLNTALVINIVIQVVLRYALGEGKIWLEELQWHFYGICILTGISYCLVQDAHIRLDVFHRNFSERKKSYIEFFGMLILVLPLFTILFLHGLGFVQSAWHVGESSPHPLGLPWRWLIKSVIPASMFLIILGALSRMYSSALVILNKK